MQINMYSIDRDKNIIRLSDHSEIRKTTKGTLYAHSYTLPNLKIIKRRATTFFSWSHINVLQIINLLMIL